MPRINTVFLSLTFMTFLHIVPSLCNHPPSPWFRNVWICNEENWQGNCTWLTFMGNDPQSTDNHDFAWYDNSDVGRDVNAVIGSFGPDWDLTCKLLLYGCEETTYGNTSPCSINDIKWPGMTQVPEPWRSNTGTVRCYLQGSEGDEDAYMPS